MESYLPFVALAGLYIYLFISSITPESAAALSNPQLADIARFFADEKAGWRLDGFIFWSWTYLLGVGFTGKGSVLVSGQFTLLLCVYSLGQWDCCRTF
jgi:hypothetical protein